MYLAEFRALAELATEAIITQVPFLVSFHLKEFRMTIQGRQGEVNREKRLIDEDANALKLKELVPSK